MNQNTVPREECEAILKQPLTCVDCKRTKHPTEVVSQCVPHRVQSRLARAHLELLYANALLESEVDSLKAKMCILAAEVDSDRSQKAALEVALDFAISDHQRTLGRVLTLESQLAEARGATIEIAKAKADQWIELIEARKALERILHASRGATGEMWSDENGDCTLLNCSCSNHIAREAIDAAGALRAKPEGVSPHGASHD